MGVPEVPEVPVGKPENKPSKKMPENPEQMNPLMLLNHLRPNTKFEELGKSGNPPNCVFTFQCTLDDETFVGRGNWVFFLYVFTQRAVLPFNLTIKE